MSEDTDSKLQKQIKEARERGKTLDYVARDAYYDPANRELVIVLKNGKSAKFPVDILQGLSGADDEVLSQVKITPAGSGVYWEALDADFSVRGLFEGRYGTKKWHEELRRRGVEVGEIDF